LTPRERHTDPSTQSGNARHCHVTDRPDVVPVQALFCRAGGVHRPSSASGFGPFGIRDFHVAGYSLGARVAIQLAESQRVRSLIAIAPDGLGTPVERLQGFVALIAGRNVAMTLAPAASLLSSTPAGRSVFFAGSRSLPQLAPADARQLLTDYADSPAYQATN